eukprot:305508-Prorocentrum_minimum.AAC.1
MGVLLGEVCIRSTGACCSGRCVEGQRSIQGHQKGWSHAQIQSSSDHVLRPENPILTVYSRSIRAFNETRS